MHGAAADAFAAVVRAERERIGAAGDAQIFPVEFVRAGFVADPVALRIPERAGFEPDHVEACARQSLQQHAAGRAAADDQVVDFVAFAEAAHRQMDLLQRPEHVMRRCRAIETAEEWLLSMRPHSCVSSFWSDSRWR